VTRALIVALDGPAGAGKSTVARRVAERAGLALVDTGAIYRTVGLLALRDGVSVDDGDGLGAIARALPQRLRFVVEGGQNRVFLDGPAAGAEEEITTAIRTPAVSAAASSVARHPPVRSALLDLQRALGRKGNGSVLEGRDIGTVVFPDADVKAFVTASPEERARRRLIELQEKGERDSYDKVLADIVARDKQDAERLVAPLKPADDAVVVDTTDKGLDQVTDEILALVERARRR
jgi:cytidylate kinase